MVVTGLRVSILVVVRETVLPPFYIMLSDAIESCGSVVNCRIFVAIAGHTWNHLAYEIVMDTAQLLTLPRRESA